MAMNWSLNGLKSENDLWWTSTCTEGSRSLRALVKMLLMGIFYHWIQFLLQITLSACRF